MPQSPLLKARPALLVGADDQPFRRRSEGSSAAGRRSARVFAVLIESAPEELPIAAGTVHDDAGERQRRTSGASQTAPCGALKTRHKVSHGSQRCHGTIKSMLARRARLHVVQRDEAIAI